jgi:Cu/Ag efflux pump CusA
MLLLTLMGIVTENAIMLVEFAIESIHAGRPREEAMIDAGMKRARPIVMTTIARIGGMPSAFGLGSGGELRAPMAIALIGGLLTSTLLALRFVPAVFSVMDDIAGMIWGYFWRCVGEADGPAEPARPTPTCTGAAKAHGLPIAAE